VNIERVAQSEDRLIELARSGDREAYGALVNRHYAGIIQVVYRMCGERQIAEDAAQEAFIRAWLKLATFRPEASFRNWLYQIALHAALDVLRRAKSQVTLDAEEPTLLADPALGPEAVVLARERAERVQTAIQSLPEAARAVLVLREYSGLSYQEISDVLDIPTGTVMSRLNYAREKLRKILTGEPPQTERTYA
jgi:RNA polymerase sigma-70 factor (ECF subfamily)